MGTAVISSNVGDPSPSVFLSNGIIESATNFRTTDNCGLRLSVAMRSDSGSVQFEVWLPGIGYVAHVDASFGTALYELCQPGACIYVTQNVPYDKAFHVYEYDELPDSAIQRWMRDGVTEFQLGGAVFQHDSLRVHLNALGNSPSGPSGGYFDNVLAIETP